MFERLEQQLLDLFRVHGNVPSLVVRWALMRLADVVALSDVPRDLRHESPESSRLNPAKSG